MSEISLAETVQGWVKLSGLAAGDHELSQIREKLLRCSEEIQRLAGTQDRESGRRINELKEEGLRYAALLRSGLRNEVRQMDKELVALDFESLRRRHKLSKLRPSSVGSSSHNAEG